MRPPRTGNRTPFTTYAVVVRLLCCGLCLSSFSLLAGCGGAVRHDSFSEFSQSMHELRDGADEALEAPYRWARDRYVDETAAASIDTTAGPEAMLGLILERDPDNVFDWTVAGEPLYLRQRQLRRGVYELNDALVEYADLLSDLANTDVTNSQFDDRTEELNAGLSGVAAALGDPDAPDRLALFSTAAVEMIRLYINDGKREHLKQALETNQGAIVAASSHIQEALRLTALLLWQEYEEKTTALADPLGPYSDLKTKDRKKRIANIVAASEFMMYQLDALEVLVESYQALPRANQELIDSLDRPGWSLTAITQIADNGLRLRRLCDELKDN